MQIIAVANQKGGCGNLTTAVNLSTYLALNGKRTLLVDLDPQGSSTRHLGINELDKTMYYVLMQGLDTSSPMLSPTWETTSLLILVLGRIYGQKILFLDNIAQVILNQLQQVQDHGEPHYSKELGLDGD